MIIGRVDTEMTDTVKGRHKTDARNIERVDALAIQSPVFVKSPRALVE